MLKRSLHLSAICLLFIILSGCISDTTTSPPETDQVTESNAITAKTIQPSLAPIAKSVEPYDIIEQWKPDNKPNGYGAVILLNQEYDERELIDLIKSISSKKDPVVIRLFTSRKAYNQEKSGSYGPEYDSDYILFYVKNLTRSGAYRGCNEIRWMQVSGKFSSKAGTKSRL